jgi:hypothetical protein
MVETVTNKAYRNFISYVEKGFQERGISCDVLLLSARLNEAAVVRRQIIEGVQAVCKLTRANQATSKIPLQIFDRRGGADNVAFEEYENIDPPIAAELVKRAKSTHQAPGQPAAFMAPVAYGIPPSQQLYGAPPYQSQQPPTTPGGVGDINSLLSSLNGNDLQKLIAAAQAQQAAQTHPHAQAGPATGLTPDLSRLLGGGQGQSPSLPGSAYPQPQTGQPNPLASLANNPALASLLGGQNAPPGSNPAGGPVDQQGQPDMAQIMAQLAKYR